MELVRSKRDSGLSGYRGALKEVDEQLTAMLRRPPLQPLAMDALGVSSAGREDQGEVKTHLDENDIAADDDATLDASAGLEFLQLLPERRTAEMAEFWWENDIRLLEKRRTAVIAERAALDEGGTVWQEAVRLVSGFEANLRKEMTVTSKDEHGGGGIKKANSPTPEERMQSQLQATAKVSKSLQSLVQKAEEKGWNLLVCAIGAELEAFQEACLMLRQVLHDAGVETERDGDEIEEVWPQFDGCHNSDSNDCLIDAEDPAIVSAKPAVSDSYDYDDRIATPKLARSARGASVNTFEATRHNHDSNAESEYDADDVPPDLLTAHGRSLEGSEKSQDRSNRLQASQNRRDDEDDSNEDEVPLEFLSEHQSDDDGES
ncbi:hypothetical protein SEPCBS119000_001681 [Sporothrix epigloea]|uniref:Uncharacterized protein n=1 Tax=Sporothrix epigloea TaxID=1892477 RepID=A0ABP0DD94_9PEZI